MYLIAALVEAAFYYHLKRRTQLIGEFLQEFAIAIDHMAHGVHVDLPKHLVSKEAARAFADRIREREKATATSRGQEDTQRGPQTAGNGH
jgi:hypothetical protein